MNEKQLYRMRAAASGREALAHAEPGSVYVDRETGLHQPFPHPSGRALRLVLDDQQGKGAHPANLSPVPRGGRSA